MTFRLRPASGCWSLNQSKRLCQCLAACRTVVLQCRARVQSLLSRPSRCYRSGRSMGTMILQMSTLHPLYARTANISDETHMHLQNVNAYMTPFNSSDLIKSSPLTCTAMSGRSPTLDTNATRQADTVDLLEVDASISLVTSTWFGITFQRRYNHSCAQR